ncbi:MAG TPA: carboxypeptidase-like regulatory domain-containing protein, partial [Puia sp.]
MKRAKIISVMIALLAIGSTIKAFGQNKQLISGDFVNIHFDDFVRTVESQSKYHFYYDSLDTDSIIVNMDISDKPLSLILENVFLHTEVHFFIDTFNRVFIIRNNPIQVLFSGKEEDSAIKIVAINTGNRETKFEKEPNATRSLLENRLFEIGDRGSKTISGSVTLTGNIRDMNNGDPLVGALIQIDSLPQQKYSDPFGNYSFKMSAGEHYLYISSGGMSNAKRHVVIYSDGVLNIDMKEYVPTLKVVIVTADIRSNVKSTIMGSDRINIKTIKQMPSVMGEADVLRAVLSLPGVTSVGEGSTGLNVRGGAADQNLILFNDATIYNPSHFFGFFSAFNPDVVKDAILYKSSIPEKYGGRLSSVLDISSREGNKKKFYGEGGLGLLTSRLCIEGPIEKDKASYLVAGRMTYSDWVLHQVPDYSNSSASFYDLNVVVSQQINKQNNLYLTGYLSQDHFKLNNDTTYGYSNHNLDLKWKHVYNDKLFGLFTLGYDSYQFGISSVSNPVNAYKFSFDVNQDFLRIDNT